MLNLSSFNLLDVHEYHLFLFVYLESGCKNICQNDFSCGSDSSRRHVIGNPSRDASFKIFFRLPHPKYLGGVIGSLLDIR